MTKLIIPYDGRPLDTSSITIHSINGDVTYRTGEFQILVSPYTIKVEFPEVSNYNQVMIDSIIYDVANLETSYTQEPIPSNKPLIEFKG